MDASCLILCLTCFLCHCPLHHCHHHYPKFSYHIRVSNSWTRYKNLKHLPHMMCLLIIRQHSNNSSGSMLPQFRDKEKLTHFTTRLPWLQDEFQMGNLAWHCRPSQPGSNLSLPASHTKLCLIWTELTACCVRTVLTQFHHYVFAHLIFSAWKRASPFLKSLSTQLSGFFNFSVHNTIIFLKYFSHHVFLT